MEGQALDDDTDQMIHELNEDILSKQEKSLQFSKARPRYADDDGPENDRGHRMSFTGGQAQQATKPLTYKQKNEAAIAELRQQLQKVQIEEEPSVRRSRTTVGQGRRQAKERASRASSQHSKQADALQQELAERLRIQERVQEEEKRLHEFELLLEIKEKHEEVAKLYNESMARDAILDLEHVELNDNQARKKQERESLQKELAEYQE